MTKGAVIELGIAPHYGVLELMDSLYVRDPDRARTN